MKLDKPDSDKRDGKRGERVEYGIEAGNDHVTDLVHVVGGACHDIAHLLAVVEGLAFAEQVQVKFVACIGRDMFPQYLRRETGDDVEETANQDDTDYEKRDGDKLSHAVLSRRDGIESFSGQDGDAGIDGIGSDGCQAIASDKAFVA